MTARSGVQTSVNQSTEGRAVRAVGAIIHELEIDKAPLTVIMTKAAGRLIASGNKKVEYFEDALPAQFDVLAADLTAVAVTMTVTNFAYFAKNMLVQVNKSEIVRVTATPTTTTVSITRAVGEVAAVAATANDQLFIIGDASEEGVNVSPILLTLKDNPYNWMEITKTDIGWTGTAMASEVYGKSDPEADRVKAIVKHARELEKKYIVGQRYFVAAGGVDGKELRTMRGVMRTISTNVQHMGGEMTNEEFDNHLRKAFRYGSNKKLLIGSGTVISVLNGFVKGKVTPAVMNPVYGLKLSKYVTPFGDLDIGYSPLLENDSLDDLTGLAGTGIVLDIANLEVHHLPNRYMVHTMNTQAAGLDGEQEEILSECCIKVPQEKMHSYFDGVTE
jgi:hypothetical protein